jgi:sugar phosphate isomerase/epimerase
VGSDFKFAVFTKPWKLPLPELAAMVKGWGFDGVELPVRPGYDNQVLPENVRRDLPKAVNILGDCGLKIYSIAGPTNEETIAACAELGIPIIRVMANIEADGYAATVARLQRQFDALLPLLEKYGVTLGVQNHYGRMIGHALGLQNLVSKYDPRYVAAIWDAAHNALQGEEPEIALDIIWPHLCMVNLKNAFWQRSNGPEAEVAAWRVYWTAGRHGLASWPRVAAELKRRNYQGPICLTAEYTDEHAVERLIAGDIVFARSLFAA